VSEPDPTLEATRRGQFASLRRRVYLTLKYHGPRALLMRTLTFPLRFTPWALRLKLGRATIERRAIARDWFAEHGRPVTVVIPTLGSAGEVAKAVRSIRRTAPERLVRIIVSDDAGPAAERAALRAIEGIELIEGEVNLGFAGNAGRGLERADPAHDVVLLNADVEAERGWLASLQYAAYGEDEGVGIVGARLLYANGQIQHAGVERNPLAPDWFDHRFRFAPSGHGPADVPAPVLAVTGACMYLKRELLDRVGSIDTEYPMAFEDVDWCLRAWQAGYRVVYEPSAILQHTESAIRGRDQGERELASQQRFWSRWANAFGPRSVVDGEGRLRIVYVTEGTEVGGGHRLVFEDINSLVREGHSVELFALDERPEWFDLKAPVRSFPDYAALERALAPLDAIKVATWWRTAAPVWAASVVHGIPVYFVQDIETTYYPDDEPGRHRVLATYRPEFRYLTTSSWNRDRLRELGHAAQLVAPGIDLDTFRPLPGARRASAVLALGRVNPLKRFGLTVDAWRSLPEPRPALRLFGVEPELSPEGASYDVAPTDARVNELLNESAVFVQTSSHEGFALPPLEAMAAGTAVVCTDADGNRDYCRDGVNCLITPSTPAAVTQALRRVLGDPELRERLGAAGIETARSYGLARRAESLRSFFAELAERG
jgi:GT2 family glycosyltransferase/glycosyltransferase involved in cell wall biosynthesis